MLRHPPIFCVLLALAGCQAQDAPSPVSGSLKNTFITEDGDRELAFGPEDVEVAALVPHSGGWQVIEGGIDRSGRFTVEDVPAGPYYLRVRAKQEGFYPYFVSVGTREIDLNSVVLGRPDAVAPTQPTQLTIDADGLASWAPGNQLHLFSLGAGAGEDDLERLANLRLPEGTERILLTIDSAQLRRPRLVDGDSLFITELGFQTQNRITYLTPVSALRPGVVVQQDGVPAGIHGSFERITTATNQLINWKLNAFAKAEPAVNPMAKVVVYALSFLADPAGSGRWGGDYLPEVLHAAADATRTTAVTFPFTAAYRNPYPKEWPIKFLVYAQYEIPWLPPWLWPTISSYGPTDPSTELQVALLLGPPLQLQVAGRDASGEVTGTGLTPALRWNAHSTGKATLYEVVVWQQDGSGEFALAAALVTDRHDAAIPPGVLGVGRVYVVTVTAMDDRTPGKPDQPRGHGARATAVTGLLMP